MDISTDQAQPKSFHWPAQVIACGACVFEADARWESRDGSIFTPFFFHPRDQAWIPARLRREREADGCESIIGDGTAFEAMAAAFFKARAEFGVDAVHAMTAPGGIHLGSKVMWHRFLRFQRHAGSQRLYFCEDSLGELSHDDGLAILCFLESLDIEDAAAPCAPRQSSPPRI